MSKKIYTKTAWQIDAVRRAGKHLNTILLLVAHAAQPGVTWNELEAIAAAYLKEHNLIGSFKWFNGFPTNLCLSVNDCVVHGIPDEVPLKAGDCLKIDCGVTYQWGIADAAISLIVWWPKHNKSWYHLIQTTKNALDAWVATIRPNWSCLPFAQTVQKTMLQGNCAIIKNLTWHGVGIEVHEWPHLYNRPHQSMQTLTWKPGWVVALEPITAIRSTDFKEKPGNERNLYTVKWDYGAQREYTIAIHDDKIEILAGIEDEKSVYIY